MKRLHSITHPDDTNLIIVYSVTTEGFEQYIGELYTKQVSGFNEHGELIHKTDKLVDRVLFWSPEKCLNELLKTLYTSREGESA